MVPSSHIVRSAGSGTAGAVQRGFFVISKWPICPATGRVAATTSARVSSSSPGTSSGGRRNPARRIRVSASSRIAFWFATRDSTCRTTFGTTGSRSDTGRTGATSGSRHGRQDGPPGDGRQRRGVQQRGGRIRVDRFGAKPFGSARRGRRTGARCPPSRRRPGRTRRPDPGVAIPVSQSRLSRSPCVTVPPAVRPG